jgi:hypothetical protein
MIHLKVKHQEIPRGPRYKSPFYIGARGSFSLFFPDVSTIAIDFSKAIAKFDYATNFGHL